MTLCKAETIFAHELNLIHDKTIKNFVIECFDKLCPDYFWTCPCSTTGKYHPQVSLGVGGLVRHTKLAVWWGLELLRAMQFEGYRDEIVATLLLHDMLKNGKGLNAQGYSLEQGVTGTHGVTLAFKINEIADLELSEATYQRIFSGIAGHMGIWTTDPAYRPTEAFANLIHLADYCASRKVDEIYSKLIKEKNADVVDRTCKNCKENCDD
ncbi:hypothetical protein LCGC14_0661510 [marine sediment metagenome]|uniref:HD domain-containing protein n=1 Tax=marine sediment metagenome TaxID=412755 RepID=A0A0F9U1R3_9ZZZZ